MWLRRILRKPVTWVALGTFAAGLAFALFWFAPWKLFTSHTVTDALPVVSAPTSGPAPTGPTAINHLLASGTFVSHEHSTSGAAQLIQLADGRRQLVLQNLTTSDGPDLHVWLTDRRVREGEWRTFDDGRHVSIAKLKGNKGNQVYDLPADLDLTWVKSVTIWCERFSVSFGAAELSAGATG
jgi:hypothetical protein